MALAEGMSMNVFSRLESNMILSLSYWYHYPLLVETIILKLSLQPLGTPAKPWVTSVRENEMVTGHAFASFSPLGVCFAVFLPGTSGKERKETSPVQLQREADLHLRSLGHGHSGVCWCRITHREQRSSLGIICILRKKENSVLP